MDGVVSTARYDTFKDATHLRYLGNELFNLEADVDRLIADLPPGAHRERLAGYQDVKAMLTVQVQHVRRRVAALVRSAPHGGEPTVLDPATLPSIDSVQGQPLCPIVSRPAVGTEGISSAEVWMPPGHAAHPHVHHDTDVIVLVRDGEAVTLWWDEDDRVHEVVQRIGQHLHIPRGVPHAALNLGQRPVIATEFRSNAVFDADNHRLPELEAVVAARLQAAVPIEPGCAA